MPVIYLRRVPTTDTLVKRSGRPKLDVVAETQEGKEVARWHWDRRPRPTKNTTQVMLNCARYKAVWR